MVIDDDVDWLWPRECFLPEAIAGGGIEGNQAVGLGRELRGEIENELRSGEKLVHGDHSPLHKEGRTLASIPQSVAEGE